MSVLSAVLDMTETCLLDQKQGKQSRRGHLRDSHAVYTISSCEREATLWVERPSSPRSNI